MNAQTNQQEIKNTHTMFMDGHVALFLKDRKYIMEKYTTPEYRFR